MAPTCKLWDLRVIGGVEQASLCQCNAIFLSRVETKTCWRAILTCCFKNQMQKDKDKWTLDHLSWKRQTHSLMKWSISHPSALCTSMAIIIKWCPSWSLLYFQILAMGLSFVATPIGKMTIRSKLCYTCPHSKMFNI
jgi:hypothetical protein